MSSSSLVSSLLGSNDAQEPTRPNMSALSSEDRFAVTCSWFLGPKAGNGDVLTDMVSTIIEEIRQGRKRYFPNDPVSIPDLVHQNKHFKQSMDYICSQLQKLSVQQANHCVPFFSPRYAAHMVSDVSLPAILGYLVAMFFNQNNVTPEAGPITTLLEYEACQDLCKMLGYTISSEERAESGSVFAWGHITCGGTVANLESMWVARNLKYYPLSLRASMMPGEPLAFAVSLIVTLSTGRTKIFGQCTKWELLNLTVSEVLDLPNRIFTRFGIPPETLEKILEKYNIQTVGKAYLDKLFAVNQPPQYLISPTNHYSWPKSAAITGIGSENLIQLKVDDDARLDIDSLRKRLEYHLAAQQPVYAVVVIAGSTEHGAVDPIAKVVELREEYQRQGLSFMIHADAAWGGYFATKVRRWAPRTGIPPITEHAFSIPLCEYTNAQLSELRNVDTITIDPHKSGYIPYPAGALCYRDGRLRFLVTWSSPYLNILQDAAGNLGIYGVQGSSPGAAASAVWLSHKAIGLDKYGYGTLLGTAMLTGVKMYMHWATMSLDSKDLIVTALKMLSSEREDPVDPKKVEAERRGITKLLQLSNTELENHKRQLQELGSDLIINPFACNFYINGKPNTDVVQANYLNDRLYERLSIRSPTDDISQRPLIIHGTSFKQESYGPCLTKFKSRLGLDPTDNEDLTALANTAMSPFPTANGLLETIMADFKRIAKEETQLILKHCYPRWETFPSIHAFYLQGTDVLHFVHFPMYNIQNHKLQVIFAGQIPLAAKQTYARAYDTDPTEPFVIFTSERENLTDIIDEGEFIGDIYRGSPFRYGNDTQYKPFIAGVKVTFGKTLVNRSIARRDLDKRYPVKTPFFLYGTPKSQHIDHVLLRAPNIHLSGNDVKLEQLGIPLTDPRMEGWLKEGLLVIMEDVYEHAMQPFGNTNEPNFFSPGKSFKVVIYPPQTHINHAGPGSTSTKFEESLGPSATTGVLTIGKRMWRDYLNINSDVSVPSNDTWEMKLSLINHRLIYRTDAEGNLIAKEISTTTRNNNVVLGEEC